ncbi:hypothetical protein KC717_03345 [Candidatus Dojkabacteria bacterium]|uniref:Uncharacterized protein n=1 Tax=Candidatus Dojkabacteria bacterium TaxID=2099670 RepID=A0A955L7X8_9BACT|nr:hypothetical protein [Candidatus Dojkabacteria bacterium]
MLQDVYMPQDITDETPIVEADGYALTKPHFNFWITEIDTQIEEQEILREHDYTFRHSPADILPIAISHYNRNTPDQGNRILDTAYLYYPILSPYIVKIKEHAQSVDYDPEVLLTLSTSDLFEKEELTHLHMELEDLKEAANTLLDHKKPSFEVEKHAMHEVYKIHSARCMKDFRYVAVNTIQLLEKNSTTHLPLYFLKQIKDLLIESHHHLFNEPWDMLLGALNPSLNFPGKLILLPPVEAESHP